MKSTFRKIKCFKQGARYSNPYISSTKKTLKDFLLWHFGYYDDMAPPDNVPEDFSYPNPREECDASKPHVTWINHSTFYVSVGGLNFLTDPIWSDRCSPMPFIGPKRKHAPPIELDILPPIHMVLISHNHYDHLDKRSCLALHKRNPNCLWIVPKGVRSWFIRRGFRHVVELCWWERFEFSAGGESPQSIRVTAVPSQHFSGRGLFDTDRSLWAGFVVQCAPGTAHEKRCYFCGDTGYNKHDFKEIGKRFAPIDLSMLPVGTYVPRPFMSPVHIDPVHATAIHQEVGSRLSIGMHWKTFKLSEEESAQPPYDLYVSMKQAELNPLDFRILDPGQIINW